MPDFETHQAKNARLSTEVRARLAGHLDLADAEKPLQKVDLFPARRRGKGPAQIFRDSSRAPRATSRSAPPPPKPRPLVDALEDVVSDVTRSIKGWFD